MSSLAVNQDAAILVVEDDAALREALIDTLELAGHSVVSAADGRAALTLLEREAINMVVADVQMDPMDGHTLLKHIKTRIPELPVLMMTAYGTIQSAVEAMRNGAADYLVKPFEADLLVGKVATYLPAVQYSGMQFVAEDVRSVEVMQLAARVAATDATVLINGESGTGKEVLARYIHQQSQRQDKPFIAINCAAIPETMLEAMLFGYEKGAFTGAHQSSAGKFEQAQGGTLLLDEISEMDLGLQAKLLRVLQEREVERLGGNKIIKLDVRVLATTNRSMREEVASGHFREDLFYRLNVFPLVLPPLRERTGDIVPLAEYVLQRSVAKSHRSKPDLSQQAQQRLLTHYWPGNVRELDNVMQRALILQPGAMIEEGHLQFEQTVIPMPSQQVVAQQAATATNDGASDSLGDDLKSREQQLILEALRAGNGSRKLAAAKLGISQRTLRYKLARMRDAGIDIPGHLNASSAC